MWGSQPGQESCHAGSMAPARNAPCPCGSGKKYKKCCGAKSRPVGSKDVTKAYVTNIKGTPTVPVGAREWPVHRAYVPLEDAWKATGMGTAGIVRVGPEGMLHAAWFWLDLRDGGLANIFGKQGLTEKQLGDFEKKILPDVPPCVQGSADDAALYVWGAHAMSPHGFPPGLSEPYLALLPAPRGTPASMKKRLLGMTPPELQRVIRRNPVPDDVPAGKDVVIITRMTFAVRDQARVKGVLDGCSPDFARNGDGRYTRTRPYPKGHTSPLALFGGRQIVGDVTIEGSRLVAEARTLSLAAGLVGKLESALGDMIALESTEWTDQEALLQQT